MTYPNFIISPHSNIDGILEGITTTFLSLTQVDQLCEEDAVESICQDFVQGNPDLPVKDIKKSVGWLVRHRRSLQVANWAKSPMQVNDFPLFMSSLRRLGLTDEKIRWWIARHVANAISNADAPRKKIFDEIRVLLIRRAFDIDLPERSPGSEEKCLNRVKQGIEFMQVFGFSREQALCTVAFYTPRSRIAIKQGRRRIRRGLFKLTPENAFSWLQKEEDWKRLQAATNDEVTLEDPPTGGIRNTISISESTYRGAPTYRIIYGYAPMA